MVKPIAEKYGVKEIYLFGSYAGGEAACGMKHLDQRRIKKMKEYERV